MDENKKTWWATGAALLVLAVAMWETMAGFILSLSMLIGLAFYNNAQRPVKRRNKAIIYGLLGAVLGVFDFAAVRDILKVGVARSELGIMMIGLSAILVMLTVYWEKKRWTSGGN